MGRRGIDPQLRLLRPTRKLEMPSDGGSPPVEPLRQECREHVTVIRGDHESTRADWLKDLVLLHSVMRETVTKAVEELAPAAVAEGTAAP